MLRSVILFLVILVSGCSSEESQTVSSPHAQGCDAAKESCVLAVDKGRITLSLGPDVKPLAPFNVIADFDLSQEAEQVTVNFQMSEMDMGLNRYRLMKKEGSWQGVATLPICTTSRMDWVAQVEYVVSGQPQRAVFTFSTQ